jgi:Carboxypeptidase regulatory-like domain
MAILWSGFVGNVLTVGSVATPIPAPDKSALNPDASVSRVDRVQAIVNTQPAQALRVQGELAAGEPQPAQIDRWLLPFDTTLKLLDIQQRELPTGEIELTSPYLLVRLQPQQILTDLRLGRAISLGDLRKLPGLKIETSDRSARSTPSGQREIVLNFSYTLPKNPPKPVMEAAPVSLAGLTTIEPPTTSLSAVQERINLSGSTSDSLNTQGEFKAVGTVLGSSWYLRVDQPKLANLLTWGVTEAMVINQSTNSDWIAGSQSPFWRRQGNPTGAYWGATTIQRQNFTPPTSLSGGDFLPNERLQSSRLGRTVSGQARPGTVVRLVRGFSTDVVGQVLVDSSGVFRFENVVVSKDGELGNGYRLLLYPNGQLTADPQVRDVTFTTVPGQLPAGAGALIASAGVNYNRESNQFIGQFDGLQGGVAYRRGISESLTVGGGVIADPLALRGSGELFWQPTGIPLQASISALSGDRWDVVSSVNYQPGKDFSANFSSDKLSSRTDLNWLVTTKLTATAKYDSLSGVAIGGNYNFTLAPNSNSNIQGTFDSNSFLRWSASHQQNNWRLGFQGNEISFNSEVSYQLPSTGGSTHNLTANYQSTYVGTPTTLSQLIWKYQSNSFQSELGYGWSGFGHGATAGIGVTLLPGLQLLGKYQGISAFTNRESFSLELQSTLDLQGGSATSTKVEELRTRGGIAIQPFFDRNGSGKQDPGEESYWHPQLVTLDKKALSGSQTTQIANRVEVRAAPGSYRIDLHAAYLPVRWRSALVDATGQSIDSLRVNVALGSYTTIAIPLTPIYTVTGIALDPTGKPISKIAVTAMQLAGKTDRQETLTNADGSYEFTDLALGAYEISIPGQSAPTTISIASTSPVLQQLNLQQTAIDRSPQRNRATIYNCEMIFVNCWQDF